MKIKLIRSFSSKIHIKPPLVVAIGNFDGVHRGHRALLERAVALKGAGIAVALSFYPHPATVLTKKVLPSITTVRQKLKILDQIGVDYLALIRFTPKLSTLSAEEFIKQYLENWLKFDVLILGPDARIGHERAGTAEYLARVIKAGGKHVDILNYIEAPSGTKIASRDIRGLIAVADLSRVKEELGRYYALDARVVHGDARGQRIGVPTANLLPNKQVRIKRGVYACFMDVDGCSYKAVTNVGVRPTFGGVEEVVEAHLLDYQGPSLYHKRVELKFVAAIREEQKFKSAEELKARIQIDIEAARTALALR